jgi:carnitine O-acetyltransferase
MASLVKREELPPDTFKGKALCMDQFKALFGSTRVPKGNGMKDCVHTYPDSTHVVVLIRNHIYYFQALWPKDSSVAVDEHDIKDILEAIQKHVNVISYPPNAAEENGQIPGKQNGVEIKNVPATSEEALGALTSLPRAEWAEARRMIEESDNEQNKKSLHVIDSALFVLVLDDHYPKGINEKAANMLHGTNELVMGPDNTLVQVGTCCNRWYDKLQLIVCSNGTAGVNFEHSAIDGHTALRYVSDIFAETVVQFAQSIPSLGKLHAMVRVIRVGKDL